MNVAVQASSCAKKADLGLGKMPMCVFGGVKVPATTIGSPKTGSTSNSIEICSYTSMAAGPKKSMNLNCGAGKIISRITDGSLGTPSATSASDCNFKAQEQCHASPSAAVSSCAGKQSCSMTVETAFGLVGDPCPNEAKENKGLAVKALCVDGEL